MGLRSILRLRPLRRALVKARWVGGRCFMRLCHGVMGVCAGDLPALPQSARVLGFRESARPLLRIMRNSGFLLAERPAREPSLALDARADELWRVCANLPRGDTYRRRPVILRGSDS